jgi:hypothetical protein
VLLKEVGHGIGARAVDELHRLSMPPSNCSAIDHTKLRRLLKVFGPLTIAQQFGVRCSVIHENSFIYLVPNGRQSRGLH